ncbi:MAG: NAD-dependent protein deacylase [Lachnospiraceae bacterium]|nr:NAD-dependent protein deacylase [Lachnospiraceae bacterium]
MMMFEQLKELIDSSNNIVFFGGAGVSTESGIPDFRSEKGIYNTVKNYGYPPETILSHTFFMNYTNTFYDFYKKMMLYPDAKPSTPHIALKKLEDMGKLKAVVTQNIDGLHQMAGSSTVYELHGSVLRNNCMKCRKFFDLDYIINSEGVPKCDECGGVVKPDVVLYEEGLDDVTVENAILAIERADMLIVGGTSLNVYPAAGLLRYYHGNKLVLINKSETPFDSRADLVLHEYLGEVFSAVLDL